MADQIWDRLKTNGGLWSALGRLITWLLQIAMLAAIFWIRANFVSRDEYGKDSKETLMTLIQIGKDMQRISDKLDTYEKLTKRDDDLESRLREMEKQLWQKHP